MTRGAGIIMAGDAMKAIGEYDRWLALSCRHDLESNYSLTVADRLWHEFMTKATGNLPECLSLLKKKAGV